MAYHYQQAPSQSHPPQKKLRSSCNECHSSKSKCTGGNPCRTCARLQIPCIYSVSNRMGRPRGTKNKKTLARLENAKEQTHSRSRSQTQSQSQSQQSSRRSSPSAFDDQTEQTPPAFANIGMNSDNWPIMSSMSEDPLDLLGKVPDAGPIGFDSFSPNGPACPDVDRRYPAQSDFTQIEPTTLDFGQMNFQTSGENNYTDERNNFNISDNLFTDSSSGSMASIPPYLTELNNLDDLNFSQFYNPQNVATSDLGPQPDGLGCASSGLLPATSKDRSSAINCNHACFRVQTELFYRLKEFSTSPGASRVDLILKKVPFAFGCWKEALQCHACNLAHDQEGVNLMIMCIGVFVSIIERSYHMTPPSAADACGSGYNSSVGSGRQSRASSSTASLSASSMSSQSATDYFKQPPPGPSYRNMSATSPGTASTPTASCVLGTYEVTGEEFNLVSRTLLAQSLPRLMIVISCLQRQVSEKDHGVGEQQSPRQQHSAHHSPEQSRFRPRWASSGAGYGPGEEDGAYVAQSLECLQRKVKGLSAEIGRSFMFMDQ